MKFKIISFYCDIDSSLYYSKHAKFLEENLKQFNLDFHIEHIESKGSYRKNCLFKPEFIKAQYELSDKPVLWLDIDSRVHDDLNIFNNITTQVDLIFATNSKNEKGNYIPKASPIFLNKTDGCKLFLNKWTSKCKHYLEHEKKYFDHEIMIEVLEENNINYGLLGYKYCAFSTDTSITPSITMGISANTSKEEGLRESGCNDFVISQNNRMNTFYSDRGLL